MKNVNNFIAAIFASVMLFLTGCASYADGTSVWGGGLWLLPLLTLSGAALFGYQAYVASKSNSTTQHPTGGNNPSIPGGGPWVEDNTGNVPIYKIGRFYFAVALLVATIVIVAMVIGDK